MSQDDIPQAVRAGRQLAGVLLAVATVITVLVLVVLIGLAMSQPESV